MAVVNQRIAIERKSIVFLHSSAFLKVRLCVLMLVLAASVFYTYPNCLARKANGKLPFIWLVLRNVQRSLCACDD